MSDTKGCERITSEQRISLMAAALILMKQEDHDRAVTVPNDGEWLFDMGVVATEHVNDYAVTHDVHTQCDTAGCIHGLVNQIEVYAGRPETWADQAQDAHRNGRGGVLHKPLYAGTGHPCRKLFYPSSWSWPGGMGGITPRMAAIAILQFLGGNDEPNYQQISNLIEDADATNRALEFDEFGEEHAKT